jgi:hypothetical protein
MRHNVLMCDNLHASTHLHTRMRFLRRPPGGLTGAVQSLPRRRNITPIMCHTIPRHMALPSPTRPRNLARRVPTRHRRYSSASAIRATAHGRDASAGVKHGGGKEHSVQCIAHACILEGPGWHGPTRAGHMGPWGVAGWVPTGQMASSALCLYLQQLPGINSLLPANCGLTSLSER